jgi:chemosensory pili system protein ChpE
MDMLMAAIMGLFYVAPPGPVNIETARRVGKNGARAGLSFQLGSLVGDALYALLGSLGVGLVLIHLRALHLIMGLVGIGLLLYLARSALGEGWRGIRGRVAPARHVARRLGNAGRQAFWLGLGMSLSSPFGLAYWVSVGSVALRRVHGRETAFVGCFLLAELLWALALPLLLDRCHGLVKSRHAAWGLMICGLFQLGSAVSLGWALMASIS